MRKKILIGLALVAVAIQFVRPEKNLSAQVTGPDDFAVRLKPPAEVQRLLTTACYDCHSNSTHYPWYAEIQPVGWWLQWHVNEGRGALNFSRFGTYSEKRQGSKLDAIMDELGDHTMPLKSYTLIHRDAKLTDAQTKVLLDWLQTVRDRMP